MKHRLLAIATSLWIIVFVALAVRVTFLWDHQRKIPHEVLASVPFEQETGNIAYALAQGKGFSNVFRQETGPTAWLTPVYPLLVAAIFKILGSFTFPAVLAAASLNILASAATCVPIFLAGKRIGDPGVASLAAWLWALFPDAIMIPTEWVWDTSLSALLAAILFWATLSLAESRRLRDWVAYGLLSGLALMTNPALGILLPLLLGWAARRARRQGVPRWLRRLVLAACVVILCCVPWTVRNFVSFHRWIPLRSNFPFELWLGNNEAFDEHLPYRAARITRYGEIRRYGELGENAYMDEKWQKAVHFIRTHPQLELRLSGERVVATWTGTASPFGDLLNSDSLLVRLIITCNLIVGFGTLAGITILFWRRSLAAFPAVAFPVVFPLVYYVTHTNLRYRHPIDPLLLLLTAVVLEAAFTWFSRGRRQNEKRALN